MELVGFVDRWACFISFSCSIMLYSRYVLSVMMYRPMGIYRSMEAGLGALFGVFASPGYLIYSPFLLMESNYTPSPAVLGAFALPLRYPVPTDLLPVFRSEIEILLIDPLNLKSAISRGAVQDILSRVTVEKGSIIWEQVGKEGSKEILKRFILDVPGSRVVRCQPLVK